MNDRPLCKCHGEPMHKRDGGYYRCAIKERERKRRYYEANVEKERERNHGYREANWEKERDRHRRRRQALKDAGRCVNCGEPVLSETLCWECLDKKRFQGYRIALQNLGISPTDLEEGDECNLLLTMPAGS